MEPNEPATQDNTDAERVELAEQVGGAVAHLGNAIETLSKLLAGWQHDQLEAELFLLRELRELRVELAGMEAVVEAKAAKLMTSESIELPGLYAKRRGGAARKSWDNGRLTERVTHHVAQHVALDTATGELDDDLAHRITEACELLWSTARPSWRTGALKRAGVAFDDCCETEYGRRTVQVSTAPIDVDGDE